MRTSESVGKIAGALSKAQGKLQSIAPGGRGEFGTYVTLGDVIETIRPVLTEHELAVVQTGGWNDGRVTLTTRLMHSSGEWIEGTAETPLAEPSERQAKIITRPQLVGMATAYLRRFGLAAMFSLAQADSDGEAATPGAVRSFGTLPAQPATQQPSPTQSATNGTAQPAKPMDLAGVAPADEQAAQQAADEASAARTARLEKLDTFMAECGRMNADITEVEAGIRAMGVPSGKPDDLTDAQLDQAIADMRAQPTPVRVMS